VSRPAPIATLDSVAVAACKPIPSAISTDCGLVPCAASSRNEKTTDTTPR